MPFLTYCSHTVEAQTGESLRRSMNGVCELYFATGDHHMMSYLQVHGWLVFTIGACRISQSSCTKYVKVKFKYLFSVSLSSYNLRNSNFFIPRFYTVKYGKHSIRNLGQFLCSKLAKTCAKQRKQVSLDVIHVSVLQPIMGKDKSQPA